MDSIKQLNIESRNRKQKAVKRCLASQVGDRLKLSQKPAPGEYVPDSSMNERISKIEDSIFVETDRSRTHRTLNQTMISDTNPMQTINDRSRSPHFGLRQASRSISANNRSQQDIKYKYVRYETEAIDEKPSIEKPNNVS